MSYYLNADLCLVSASNLSPLAKALRGNAEVTWCLQQGDGKWYATFNALGSGVPGRTPLMDVDSLLAAMEALDGTAAKLFSGCERKEMNVGWQSTEKRPEGAFSLPPKTLEKLAAREITLEVTVYPPEEADSGHPEG